MKILLSENVYSLFEDYKTDQPLNIAKNIIARVPFLKQFDFFQKKQDRLEAQLAVFNQNVTTFMKDEMLVLPQFNIVTDFTFKIRPIHDNVFYIFSIKHNFGVMYPKDMDSLTERILLIATRMQAEKMSYFKEVVLKEGEQFSPETLNTIINDMNKNFFEIDDYAKQQKINFLQ